MIENIKNFPLIYKLSEKELENLESVVQYLKPILNNDFEITKFIEIFNKIKLDTINTQKKAILDITHNKEIDKRAEELSKQYNLELKNNFYEIKTEKEELEENLLNYTKQLKEKQYEIELGKKQNNNIQLSLDNITNKHEETINKIGEQNFIREEKLKEDYNKKEEKFEIKINKLEQQKDELNNKLITTCGITNNSQRKGVNGENITEKLYVPKGWIVHNKAKENNSGDHQFINPDSNNKICVDTKNYKTIIPSSQLDKLIKDTITTNSDAGIIISQHTSISWNGKPIEDITYEYINSKPILFIPSACNLTPDIIKNYIILFDKIITERKSHDNIVNIDIKISNVFTSLNNNNETVKLLKESFKTQHNSFIKFHNKNEKLIKKIESEINELILNINKDIKLNNDDELSVILKKPNDAGHSVQEISILKNNAIKNINPIETPVSNLMNGTYEEPGHYIKQFIIKNIDINDKNNGQYNSILDIKNAFIKYSNDNEMRKRFSDVNKYDLSCIVIDLGYTEQTTYGRNYKNKIRRKGVKTYNINLNLYKL